MNAYWSLRLLEYMDTYWSLHNYSAFHFVFIFWFCFLVGFFAFLFKLEAVSSSYPQKTDVIKF